jgi:hypothetical protein
MSRYLKIKSRGVARLVEKIRGQERAEETMETIAEMTLTVSGLQDQFASFNVTMDGMRLMLHTLLHQSGASTIPLAVLPPLPAPAAYQLTHIPESSHSSNEVDDIRSTVFEGSTYRRSPEKKTRKQQATQNPLTDDDSTPTGLEDVQMQLFEDRSDGTQATSIDQGISDTTPPNDIVHQSIQTPNHPQDTPSPPDA